MSAHEASINCIAEWQSKAATLFPSDGIASVIQKSSHLLSEFVRNNADAEGIATALRSVEEQLVLEEAITIRPALRGIGDDIIIFAYKVKGPPRPMAWRPKSKLSGFLNSLMMTLDWVSKRENERRVLMEAKRVKLETKGDYDDLFVVSDGEGDDDPMTVNMLTEVKLEPMQEEGDEEEEDAAIFDVSNVEGGRTCEGDATIGEGAVPISLEDERRESEIEVEVKLEPKEGEDDEDDEKYGEEYGEEYDEDEEEQIEEENGLFDVSGGKWNGGMTDENALEKVASTSLENDLIVSAKPMEVKLIPKDFTPPAAPAANQVAPAQTQAARPTPAIAPHAPTSPVGRPCSRKNAKPKLLQHLVKQIHCDVVEKDTQDKLMQKKTNDRDLTFFDKVDLSVEIAKNIRAKWPKIGYKSCVDEAISQGMLHDGNWEDAMRMAFTKPGVRSLIMKRLRNDQYTRKATILASTIVHFEWNYFFERIEEIEDVLDTIVERSTLNKKALACGKIKELVEQTIGRRIKVERQEKIVARFDSQAIAQDEIDHIVNMACGLVIGQKHFHQGSLQDCNESISDHIIEALIYSGRPYKFIVTVASGPGCTRTSIARINPNKLTDLFLSSRWENSFTVVKVHVFAIAL